MTLPMTFPLHCRHGWNRQGYSGDEGGSKGNQGTSVSVMASGGRRSISRTTAHSESGSLPNSSTQSLDGSNSAASTSTRKARGKTKNQALTDYINVTGQKPRIEIPLGLARPIGKWSKEYMSECDAETLQELGRTEFYKKTHYVESEFGSHRTSPLAEQNYEVMKKLQSQPVQDGAVPMTEDDICDEILGIGPGYTRGLGHDKVPLSSLISFNPVIIELTRRAEEAEKLNEELKELVLDQDQKIEEMKATQDRKMEEMQANMEGMATKLEAFISMFGRGPSS